MKKLLIAVAALFSLIILILITAVAVPFFISANVYKAQITSLIEKETDRDFRIDGPITVTLLPQLALSAQDVSFANTPGGIAPQMAQLRAGRAGNRARNRSPRSPQLAVRRGSARPRLCRGRADGGARHA